jgi:biotin synthase
MFIEDILNKKDLTRDDIIKLLSIKSSRYLQKLFKRADEIRQEYCGDEVHLRGIIELSNFCDQNCLYCGIRSANKKINRYRMTKKEIIETARLIHQNRIRTVVLQSGEDHELTGNDIAEIIRLIKKETGAAVTLSLGERSFDDYKLWKEAGADRYLLKHETANPDLYYIIHQKQKLKDRVDHLKFLDSIGFQIGSGNIIGLPGQTIEDIADDILLCKELNVDMASFSPFISSPETPLRGSKNCNVNLALITMAVGRIVLKDSHIPATTALGTIDSAGREKGLMAGANVIMPNFTPSPYRENYSIYPDKKCMNDNPLDCRSCLETMIKMMGRKISEGKGNTLKLKHV